MASAKFFRRQAERCAELVRQTSDEDARQRCEQLQHTYSHLAEMEEQEALRATADSAQTD
jgi:thioester reductase-like protein